MIKDYKIFKSELMLYKHYNKQYLTYIKKSEEIIKSLSSLPSSSGVNTITVTKRTKKGTITKQIPQPKLDYDPMRSLKRREDMFSLSADYEQEAYQYKLRIDEINDTLNHLPEWLRIKCVNTYINGLGNKLAQQYAESKATFYRHLDEELKEYLENEK